MAKSIVLGNGHLTTCLDDRGQITDIYFPYVGEENHISSQYYNRIGVWFQDNMYWLDDPSWKIDTEYKQEMMVSNIHARNEEIGIKLIFHDVVYNESNIFVRSLQIKNLSTYEKNMKLFFDHQLRVYDNPYGDTGYYDPTQEAIIHYLGRRAFLFNMKVEDKECGFDDYSVGLFGIEGKEGTYKDAEDGELTQNPIEHGSVSECIGTQLHLGAESVKQVYYWFTAGESIEEAQALNEDIIDRGPQHLQTTASDYWQAWTNKQNFSFYGLDKEMIDLFHTSQLLIRSHMDNNGSVIASLDSDMLKHGRDTYSYMWPRDGAYVTFALEKMGDMHLAKRFFQFCNDVIRSEGYFMHKYRSDKSVGSSWHPWIRNGESILPIQEDETALVLITLWEHYASSRDIEFIEEIYNDFIENAAEFMVDHTLDEYKLPKPSYDLWEEKFGISTYTSATVYGGLIAACKFADLLGKEEKANKYNQAAQEIQEGIMDHLYDEEEGYFYKLVNIENGEISVDNTIDISSIYGIFMYKVLDLDDPRLDKAMKNMLEHLRVDTEIGGIRRYEGDVYYQNHEDVPGNPWILATLWVAQYRILKAETKQELEEIKKVFKWVCNCSLESGILPEQVDPYTAKPYSATPLAWSHAEYTRTVVMYLEKLEELGICKACYPIDKEEENKI